MISPSGILKIYRGGVLVIAGPTASGKSAFAENLAQEIDGVIINSDSLQVYDALPILTAQPTYDIKKLIPHELYAYILPSQKITAAVWKDHAENAIRKTLSNNKIPIIVGGTGFYIKTLMFGLSPFPEVPSEIRNKVVNFSLDDIQSQLKFFCPEVLEKYSDPQRLKRALEVFLSSGKSILFFQDLPPEKSEFDFQKILIQPSREILKERAKGRLREMIDSGVIEEVGQYKENIRIPTIALGYQEFSDYLDGLISLENAFEKTLIHTYQYIKRQATWFKNQMVFDWVLQ